MAQNYSGYDGRLVLITGGSSGLGLALAQLLAREGARVWILARHKEKLDAALRSLPAADGQHHGRITADVTNWDRVHAAVRRVKEEAGIPDLLINCAGAAHPAYVEDTPLAVFNQMMELNYFGTVHMVKALLPDMLARGSGHIVNTSSMAGFYGPFGYAAYSGSKYAVRGFSDVLRLELKLKRANLRVSIVFPPDMDTPGMVEENRTKPFETRVASEAMVKLLPPGKVAAAVLRGIRRGQYIILPGLDAQIQYRLVFLLGDAIYPVMDTVFGWAGRKKNMQ